MASQNGFKYFKMAIPMIVFWPSQAVTWQDPVDPKLYYVDQAIWHDHKADVTKSQAI